MENTEYIETNKKEYFAVHAPKHYTNHPSGVECIEIASELNFCLGNAFKYIFRRKYKGSEITNLKKALWYVKYEIKHHKLNTNFRDFAHINIADLNKVISAENKIKPVNTFGKILENIVNDKNLELVQKMLEIEIANLEFALQKEQQGAIN